MNLCCWVTSTSGVSAYVNCPLHVIVSEGASNAVGDGVFVSLDVWIRAADPRLLYPTETLQHINLSKDILVGDHVRLGRVRQRGSLLTKRAEGPDGS